MRISLWQSLSDGAGTIVIARRGWGLKVILVVGATFFILFATILAGCWAQGPAAPHPPQAPSVDPPFYRDKFDLLMYLDKAGQKHPILKAEGWAKRREHIVANMELVMGPLPDDRKKVPLDVAEVKVEKLPGLTRKTITYVSEAGHRVPAYLLIPDNLKTPAPAMLCLHGSAGYGGRTAGLGRRYPRYTLELAQRGYVTIAPDYPMMGGNRIDPYKLGYISGTMKGIWDHMRAVDLLQSMPEVDAGRIGCIGVSLGGHNSLFVAVFDPRIKAIVTSSGFDSFEDYLGGDLGGWCQTCYMPRIASVYGKDPKLVPFDFPEILAALAPRPLFIHAPLGDGNFKAASVKKCVKAALGTYRLFGAESNLTAVYPEGRHGFPLEARKQAYEFLDGVLRSPGHQPFGKEIPR